MELFSQRKGLKPIRNLVQIDSMDSDLRNGLWNALTIFYWNRVSRSDPYLSYYPDVEFLIKFLWIDYFKRPLDSLGNYWPEPYKEIREYFFNCHWNEVYDFIEFIVNTYDNQNDKSINLKFKGYCNSILERELSAYRFVGEKLTQITSEEEIAEIEKALESPKTLKAVTNHLKRALDLLSDRQKPDYRNSIKESISAVEAICQLITDNDKATLGQATAKGLDMDRSDRPDKNESGVGRRYHGTQALVVDGHEIRC